MSVYDRGCDWYCDNCGTYLNDQDGFTAISGTWRCEECGYLNDVSDDNIIDDSSDERISVYDAALIWVSHGMDEDYMFGYSADELEDALS